MQSGPESINKLNSMHSDIPRLALSTYKSQRFELATVIYGMMLLLLFLQYRSEMMFRVAKYPLLLVGLWLLADVLWNERLNLRITAIYSFFLFFAVLNMVFVGNINKFILIKMFVVYFSMALFLLLRKEQPLMIWTVAIALLWLYILFSLFRSDGYHVFYSTSRNYVSVFVMVFVFMLTVVWNNNGYKLPLVVSFAGFITCMIAVGRGGIVASGILFGLFVIRDYRKAGKYKPLAICGTIIFFVFAAMLVNADLIELLLNKLFSRFVDFRSTGSNNVRMYIYSTYLQAASRNLKNLLLGVNTLSINNIITGKGGNLHTSYFQLHAYMGLIPCIAFVVLIIRSFRFFAEKKEYDHMIVLFAFLVRSLFDHCFTGEIGDIVIAYYILKPYINASSVNSA